MKTHTRTAATLLSLLFSLPALAPAQQDSPAAERPNILLITADDLAWDATGPFGSPVPDITPNLDRLAGEGMRFARAHVTVAVCQPSRSVLMTGRYPHRNGAMGFQPVRADVPILPELLKRAGYISGILGKVEHLEPRERFDWAFAREQAELGMGRNPGLYAKGVSEFIALARKEGRPFFLMANSHDPHRPLHGSSDEQRQLKDQLHTLSPPSRVYRPEEVVVPGFLPDLPEVRKEMAQYYSSVRRFDDFVGAVLTALDRSGEADNTLVMFLSDNGMPFPFAKSNTYLHSTKTPWLVRWPRQVAAGAVDSLHFISGIDFMPTVLAAARIEAPGGMDGRSFLPVLQGGRQEGRNEVFTVYHETSGKRKFPMRARHEGRYGYVYNAWADGKTRFQVEAQNGLTFDAMVRAAERDPEIASRVELFLHRAPEELYDLEKDPNSHHNLAGDPEHREVLRRMRGELVRWMARTEDDLLTTYEAWLRRAGQS